jgi:hypothetical protein
MRLKTLLPHVKVVYMTGYLEQGEGNTEFLDDALFLQKPFSRETIVRQLTEAINTKSLNTTAPGSTSITTKQATPASREPIVA